LPDGAGPGKPIVLRRPVPRRGDASETNQGDIVLPSPPAGKKRDVSRGLFGGAAPVGFMPVNQVALRPALDQSDRRSSGTGAQIQLGAWRSAAEAHAGWAQAKARAG